jgi:hypothetical protein
MNSTRELHAVIDRRVFKCLSGLDVHELCGDLAAILDLDVLHLKCAQSQVRHPRCAAYNYTHR